MVILENLFYVNDEEEFDVKVKLHRLYMESYLNLYLEKHSSLAKTFGVDFFNLDEFLCIYNFLLKDLKKRFEILSEETFVLIEVEVFKKFSKVLVDFLITKEIRNLIKSEKDLFLIYKNYIANKIIVSTIIK